MEICTQQHLNLNCTYIKYSPIRYCFYNNVRICSSKYSNIETTTEEGHYYYHANVVVGNILNVHATDVRYRVIS